MNAMASGALVPSVHVRGRPLLLALSAAAGLVFDISDALTQTVHIMSAHPLTALLTSWPGYSLSGASLVARAPALIVLGPARCRPQTPRERVSLPTVAQIISRPLAATTASRSG
ncbi:MAG TPA: hypothetical protein VME44_11765 [Streptosporangiaceae bacterium]|nr:hypothetical protein [Streptosporangiaceae bacterium]